MENEFDIFNLSLTDFKQEETQVTKNVFKPDTKLGKEGVYKAVVRFLPWHKDVKKSVMKKWSSWLHNPATDEGRMIDCPSTIGKKSVIQDLFWKYKKSESVADQKIAENFSRRQKFASLVQIVKDDNNPDTVGKIMVWPYGIKIYNKLQAEMKPEFGKPHIPFDLFEGKPFLVHVNQVAGYNNYDNCRFLDEKMPITIDGEKMEKTPECMEKIKEYLNGSPDLSAYDYQEWDKNTEDFVNQVIQAVVPGGRAIESIEKINSAPKVQSKSESVNVSPKKSSAGDIDSLPNIDDLDEINTNSFDDDLYADL